MSRLVLVGEDNSRDHSPRLALFPLPKGTAGYRLMNHLGLWRRTYVALERVNLCNKTWSANIARGRAIELLREAQEPTVFVLLGGRVAQAFLAAGPPFTLASTSYSATSSCTVHHTLARLPHPSGRNLLWNPPEAREKARELLREVAPWVAWGETERAAGTAKERSR